MKHLFIVLLLALSATSRINAQEVYQEVMNMAREKADDPQTNATVREINEFKVTALTYLALKMREEMPDAPATVLDNEAYALYSYVDLYTRALVAYGDQPAAFQRQITQLFMDISYDTPLFNDADKEMVLTYFRRGESIIRFSLDTDWVKAVEKITEKLKTIQ